jgi:glycosyltransferase involved in cell wall biosynthesis
MPANTSISVVVTHRNRPDQVASAVQSLLQQSRRADEIIIVDDASTRPARLGLDALASIAKIHANPVNLGPSASRNRGTAEASGDFVAFLDDDDVCLPHRLETQLRYLTDHPECGLVGSGAWAVTSPGRREYWGERETGAKRLGDALQRTAAMAGTIFARRHVLTQHGGFDQRLRWFEDFELGIRLLNSGVGLHFIGEPLVEYRLGAQGRASSRAIRMIASHASIVWRYRALYRKELGRFGATRVVSDVCRLYGRQGGLVGSALWLLAGGVQRLVGAPTSPTSPR